MAGEPDPDIRGIAVPGAAPDEDRSTTTAQRLRPDDAQAAGPVLFVADAGAEARRVTESALLRRFAPDYRVVTADSRGAALQTLRDLADRGEQVALMAVDLRLPGTNGVDVLQRAHELHPTATRVVLVEMDRHHTRVPFEELGTLRSAIALGRIDFWIMKGWATPEEWLYPQVQDALTAWTMAHVRRHLVYRIVGEQWAPRSHEMRDALTRNGVPFAFHPVDSPAGRQLVRDFAVDVTRLSAVISHDGTVLHDPRHPRKRTIDITDRTACEAVAADADRAGTAGEQVVDEDGGAGAEATNATVVRAAPISPAAGGSGDEGAPPGCTSHRCSSENLPSWIESDVQGRLGTR